MKAQEYFTPAHGYSAIPARDFRHRWSRRLDIGSKTLLILALVALAVVALKQLSMVIGG